MPVPTVVTDLSTTAGSNFPSGSDAPSTIDDTLRAHGAFIRELYNGTNGAGYHADGGTVTQLTSRSTTVTLNKRSGTITTHGASLAAGTEVAFLLSNSTIDSNDVVVPMMASVSDPFLFTIRVGSTTSGGATLVLKNESASPTTEAPTISFVVLSVVTS